MLPELTPLPVNEIVQLLTICLNSGYFQCNEIIYKQIQGTPMGSPVSVILAEMSMQRVEE